MSHRNVKLSIVIGIAMLEKEMNKKLKNKKQDYRKFIAVCDTKIRSFKDEVEENHLCFVSLFEFVIIRGKSML